MRVSALVSTYNGETFLRGCLDDLMAQTLWQQGDLQIIVINAGSKQHEARIIREYLENDVPLTVITSLREPMYVSFNRGVRMAMGDYCTIANVDDRHRSDALERLADALDAAPPDTALAYADCYVTPTPNATWDGDYRLSRGAPYTTGRLDWPKHDPARLLQQCYIGPQPMWRREINDELLMFDESYIVAGDYEFALRLVADGYDLLRVPEVLGLFYWNPATQGRTGQSQSAMESRRAVLKWRKRIG